MSVLYSGTGFWLENLKEGDHLQRLGIDGRIVFKQILKNKMGGRGQDSSGSGWGLVAVSCGSGNDISGSITCEKCLDLVSNYDLVIKDPLSWKLDNQDCRLLTVVHDSLRQSFWTLSIV